MRLESFPRALLFLIFCVWTTGAAAAITFSVTESGNAQLSAVEYFGAKTQLGGEASLSVLFPQNSWLSLGVSAGAFGMLPSDLRGGFGYRAYSGGLLGFIAEASAALGHRAPVSTLRGGARLGMLANVASYCGTSLAFFFPSIALDSFLLWTPTSDPLREIGLTIPVRLLLRRDLQIAASAGLGMIIAVSKGKTP
jgi:hypothetical protein